MSKMDRREALKAGGALAGLFALLGGKAKAETKPLKLKPADDPLCGEPDTDIVPAAPEILPPKGAWWVRELKIKRDEVNVTSLGDAYKRRVPTMATIQVEIVSPDGLMSMKMTCLQTSFTASTPDAAARLP